MDKIQTCIDRFDNELLNLHKVFVSQEKIDYKYFDFSNAIKILIEEVTIANEQENYKTVIAQYIHTLEQLFAKPYCVMKMEVKIDDVKMTETTTTTKYYPMGNKQPETKVTIDEFDVEELELKKEMANSINSEDNPCIVSESLYSHIMAKCNCIGGGIKNDIGFITQKNGIDEIKLTEYNDALNHVSYNSFFHHIEYLKDKRDFITSNIDLPKQDEVLKIDSEIKPKKPVCADDTKELEKFFFPDSVTSFIECEKRLMSDGYIDENRYWKKAKDKMKLVEFILTLKENGYFKPLNKTIGGKLKDTDLRSFFEKRYNVNIMQQMQPSKRTKIRVSFSLYPIEKQK